MAPRLSGQNCKFFKFLLSSNSQKRLRYKENNTKYRSLTRKPRSHVRILIYRTWPITKSPFDTSSDHLLSTLDWERLFLRRKKQKALMMFKSMNGLAPEYPQSLFSQRRSVYNLRDSEGKLTLPKPSTNYLKRSFSYSGTMLWNNMPKSLKTAVSVNHFKQLIKKVTLADISDSHTAIM